MVGTAALRGAMSDQGRGFARFYLPLIGLAALLLTAVFVIEFAVPARALPSYARQTGQPCGTCHTDFAGLTPYGRRFKINGYTAGGGQYRTTLFPFDDSINKQRPWVPPISMMATLGFTHTATDMPPPADPFAPNNNITIPPLSFFWGGAITDRRKRTSLRRGSRPEKRNGTAVSLIALRPKTPIPEWTQRMREWHIAAIRVPKSLRIGWGQH